MAKRRRFGKRRTRRGGRVKRQRFINVSRGGMRL